MNKHLLITGASGFVGKSLLPLLSKAGFKTTCTTSGALPESRVGESWCRLDINEPKDIERVLGSVMPSHIIHLAAISHVPTSFDNPRLTWVTNVLGTQNLVGAILKLKLDAFFLYVSSSEVYGETFKKNTPLVELDALVPLNPYAASKAASEFVVKEFFRQGGRGVIARPFNHLGPMQSDSFVAASFAKQIAQIERGMQPPILKVGNLLASRDFLDVRDVCQAYISLLNVDLIPSDNRLFNISSSVGVQITTLLDSLLNCSKAEVKVEEDMSRMRPSDIPFAIGDSSNLNALTGWQPTYKLHDTLLSVLDYWRDKVGRG